jgi:GMP synthase-like glutamine amidotransferase
MKIAFLHAGFPPDPLKSEHGDYLTMFQKSFRQCNVSVKWVAFQVQQGELPTIEDGFDGYICCGSPNSVYDDEPWIDPLLNFVRLVDKAAGRMVGICFGHQLIAQALGGRVEKAKQGWGLGNLTGEVLASQSWMTPQLDSVDLLYSHQDQVTKLPNGAKLIISTDHCQFASYQIENRFLAIQGHPEIEPPYLNALLEHRRERIGSSLVDRAKNSLNSNHHNRQVIAWIVNFLQQQT